MDLAGVIYFVAQCLPGFLLAVVIHEAAHAAAALYFGDKTAQRMGRLTLNPIVHADVLGTLILPMVGIVAAATGAMFPIIGWAKPVPIETRNFRNYKQGLFWVSFAGPLSNLILGTFCAFLLALVAVQQGDLWGFQKIFLGMLQYSIFINFILAIFNLIPLPPLDGSNMLSVFLSHHALMKYRQLADYSSLILWGILGLSMMGIPILQTLLAPAHYLSRVSINFFLLLLTYLS